MQPHSSLFEEQKKKAFTTSQADVEVERSSFIKFETEKSAYLVAIEWVREVTDQTNITPYPEETPGHLGLISLRGEILPVIQLEPDVPSLAANRLIVFEFEDGAPFCLKATQIKKVSLPTERIKNESIFNIDGKAARVLDASHPLVSRPLDSSSLVSSSLVSRRKDA